jgi:hypothetical protein
LKRISQSVKCNFCSFAVEIIETVSITIYSIMNCNDTNSKTVNRHLSYDEVEEMIRGHEKDIRNEEDIRRNIK